MNLDYRNYDASKGWSLREARERFVDPDTWRNLIAADENYRVHKMLTDGYAREIKESEEEHEMLRRRAEEASYLPSKELWFHLLSERLCATGSRASISELPTQIFAAAWDRITAVNWEQSVIRETVPPHTLLYNVRIYPSVHGVNAAKRLFGRSFVQAFRKYVLEDPELVARGKEVIEECGHESVFREGQMPGMVVRYTWPLNVSASSLAFDFANPGMIVLGGPPIPEASEAIKRAATVFVDRWRGLIRLLSSGSIVARGTFVQSGEVRMIDPLQWDRSNVSIDVRDGDFMEPDANGKLAVRWSGLSFVAPRSKIDESFAPLDLLENGLRPRPKTELVANALVEVGIDLRTSKLSLKAIAALVAPKLPDEPKTAAQIDALTKMVGRLRTAARNAS